MNISKQDTDKFKDKVEELIRKYYLTKAPVCLEDFLMELCKYAVEQSTNYVPIMETHGTGVNDTQLDFNLIMLSIGPGLLAEGNITADKLQGRFRRKQISDLTTLIGENNAYVNILTKQTKDKYSIKVK